jgi:transposase-like protein
MGVMIQETMTHACRAWKSTHSVKNGTNRCGNAQYHCKDGGTYRVLKPKPAYSESDNQTVLRAGLERCSLRGGERIFDITRQTVVRWISTPVQKLPEGAETLLPASPDDVLELDEVWSFVLKKAGRRWLWTAMCRRTRQIVAFASGDREPCHMPSFVEGHPG